MPLAFLPALIGYQRTAEIFFTGKILTAQEAFDLGLYNRVVPPEEVMSAARELAGELAQKPTAAIAAGRCLGCGLARPDQQQASHDSHHHS